MRAGGKILFKSKQSQKIFSGSASYQNAYYEQFKTMFFLLRLFGKCFVKKLPHGRGEFESPWLSWLAIYCFINYTWQTCIAVLDVRHRFNGLSIDGSYDHILFTVLVISYQQIHFHVPFTYWAQSKRLAEYLNMWTRFQDDWFDAFGKSLVLRRKSYNDGFTVAISVIFSLVIVTENFATLHDPWHYLLTYYVSLVSTSLVLIIWHNTCAEIAILLNTMRQELLEKLSAKPDKTYLYKWRKLWLSLDTLASSLGNNLSLIIISLYITYGISFILAIYNSQSQFFKGSNVLTACGYLIASCISLVFIFVICNASNAIEKARNTTTKNVLQIRLTALERETVDELDAILFTISNNPLQIDLLGFVTVNRKLFISFLSNVFTYLIVLVQFKR